MREPVAREASGPDAIGEAARRLDRALTRVEKLLAARGTGGGSDLFDHDRSALAAELDAARARERALEEAASAASDALGRAAAEVRLALGEDDPELDVGDEGAGWEEPRREDVLEAEGETAGADHKDSGAAGEGDTAPDAEPDASQPQKDAAS